MKLNEEQLEHFSHNVQTLRNQSGKTIKDFMEDFGSSPATYHRYINKETNPTPFILKTICEIYCITINQLINTNLSENILLLHPERLLFFSEDLDAQIIDAIEVKYSAKISDIVKAFNEMEIYIEFLPDIKRKYEETELEYYIDDCKTDYKEYSQEVLQFVAQYYVLSQRKKNKKTPNEINYKKIPKNYKEYYSSYYYKKRYLLDKLLNSDKDIACKVYFRKIKEQITDDVDFFETVKELTLHQFLKYADNYQKKLTETFHIQIVKKEK